LCAQCAAGDQYADIFLALAPIQCELFVIGALLAAVGMNSQPKVRLDDSATARMERQIDAAMAATGPLKHFVIPGGCELASRLHVARTVCRRAERCIADLADAGADISPAVTQFINRLGDLLFALAHMANKLAGIPETNWPNQTQKPQK